ncbi:MAG: hypothetical protein ABI136_01995, partial [Ginsengibacter sp.]
MKRIKSPTNERGVFKGFLRILNTAIFLIIASCLHVSAGGVSPGIKEFENNAPVNKFISANIVVQGKVINEEGNPLVGVSVTVGGS